MAKNNIIYGRHPITDAIQSGQIFDKVLIQKGIRGEFEREIRQLTKQYNIPLQYAPKERMNKLVSKNHQGIIGFIAQIPYYLLEDVLPTLYEKETLPLVLILDGITDVRNMGAIARTAECAGVQALVIPKKNTAPINADAIKSSAGALIKLPVCRVEKLSAAIDFLQQSGFQVLASDLKASVYLHQMDFSIPTAIIVGAEDVGVRPHLLKKVNQQFKIPQVGTTDSYNVSVATGMILYEVLRKTI